jgi:hypothetical protein
MLNDAVLPSDHEIEPRVAAKPMTTMMDALPKVVVVVVVVVF